MAHILPRSALPVRSADQDCGSTSDAPKRIRKARVAEVAERQFGRITWAQLRRLGAAEATVNAWVGSDYLIPVLPRVYAVGHRTMSRESALFEVLLFAGPDATLSHGTAAWWRGLLSWPVEPTHISTPRDVRSPRRGIEIHGRRTREREIINGLPVTTITETMLDLAASESLKLVRHALAQLEYTGEFDPAALHDACVSGRPGGANLRGALRAHLPELAHTRSELENEFVLLCERHKLPMPLMNRTLHGVEPDAWWPEFNLVVELDGDRNHRTPAQRAKDRRKELVLRGHGLTVLRYDHDLVMRTPAAVSEDLRRQTERKPTTAARSERRPERNGAQTRMATSAERRPERNGGQSGTAARPERRPERNGGQSGTAPRAQRKTATQPSP